MTAARGIVGVLFGPPRAGGFLATGEEAFARAMQTLSTRVRMEHWEEVEPDARTARLRAVAGSRPGLIVLHGAQGEAAVTAVAPDHPDVAFVVVQGRIVGANVASYEVSLEQPAFVAGALAAWCTRSGHVGYLSGEKVGAGLRASSAFAAGVAYGCDTVRFTGVFCGAQHDAACAESAALDLNRAGVDIVFSMLGTGRDGVNRACRATGMRQIGDGADWCAIHPDVFLASVCTDAGWAAEEAMRDFAAGRLRLGEQVCAGMERPEVCRLALGTLLDGTMRDAVRHLCEAVASGAVAIPGHRDAGRARNCD
jgi:basic membrane protein A